MSLFNHDILKYHSIIFSLYLIIAVNFLSTLFSCQIQSILYTNIYVIHIVALCTLFFFVLLVRKQTVDDYNDEYLYFKNMLKSVFLYIIFVCSLRLHDNYLLVFISLIGINFVIINYIDSLNPIKFAEKIKTIEFYSQILNIISILVLVIGMYKYYLAKKLKYRSKFNHVTFLIGANKTC